jgi:hypothetical protein
MSETLVPHHSRKVAPHDAKTKTPQMASLFELFRFATCFDILCIFLGFVGGVVQGATQPLQMIIFGDFMDASSFQNPMDMFTESE